MRRIRIYSTGLDKVCQTSNWYHLQIIVKQDTMLLYRPYKYGINVKTMLHSYALEKYLQHKMLKKLTHFIYIVSVRASLKNNII